MRTLFEIIVNVALSLFYEDALFNPMSKFF